MSYSNLSTGALLRQLREEHGMTLMELALLVGRSHSLLSKLERERVKPNIDLVERILRIYASRGATTSKLDRVRLSIGTKHGPSDEFVQRLNLPIETSKLTDLDKQILVNNIRQFTQVWEDYFLVQSELIDGNWNDAKLRLKDATYSLEHLTDNLKARFYESQARVLRYEGNTNTSLSFLEAAQQAYESLGEIESESLARVLLAAGDILRRKGSYNRASDKYSEALQLSVNKRLFVYEVMANRKLAGLAVFMGKPGQALNYVRSSVKEAKKISYLDGLWRGFQIEAWALMFLGRWDEAISLKEESLRIVLDLEAHPLDLAKSYRYIADGHLMLGNLTLASSFYLKAEKAISVLVGANQLADETLFSISLHLGKGRLELERKNYGTAEKCFRDCLRASYNSGDEFRRGLAHMYLGRLRFEMHNYPEARIQLNRAIEVFDDGGSAPNFYYLCESLVFAGLVMFGDGNLDAAREALRRASRIVNEEGFPYLDTLVHVVLGIFSYESSVKEEALEHLDKAIKASSGIDKRLFSRLISYFLTWKANVSTFESLAEQDYLVRALASIAQEWVDVEEPLKNEIVSGIVQMQQSHPS